MALNIRALKREFEIRTWRTIIEANAYVAVIQISGGRAWGRTNMKSRIIGPLRDEGEGVDARFAVGRLAREGAQRTRFKGLEALFRGGSSAVVFGNGINEVVEGVRRAKKEIDGGFVVGGRFGERIVTGGIWDEVLESDGERAEWARFLKVVGAGTPAVAALLSRGSPGLVDALELAGGAARLTNVVSRIDAS